ncbi:MAG: CCA tRNA nucleotidyltransferase [Candidatus Geothermarchaeales archaeon]
MNIESLLEHILEEIRPSPRKILEIRAIADRFLETTGKVASEINPEAEVFLGGSVRKGTYLSSEIDVDIFVLLPPSLSREEFERVGLKVGGRVLEGYDIVERWADHPYVEGTVEGLKISVIPAYRTKPPKWKSAVDRTFYHVQYAEEHLDSELRDQIRLLKRFMKSIGVYGAESAIGGFSGYLCELLIIAHGSLLELLKAGASWRPPKLIDVEGHFEGSPEIPLQLFEEDPLIVVDPVDRGRNVAAAVSRLSFSLFISASHALLSVPRRLFFERPVGTPEDLRPSLTKRKGIIGIMFHHGVLIEDTLHPQLERLARNFETKLREFGFNPLRWEAYSDYRSSSLLLFELHSLDIPEQYLHLGPYPYDERHETSFLRENLPESIHVWITRKGRWAALKRRRVTTAVAALEMILQDIEIIPRGIRGEVSKTAVVLGTEGLTEIARRIEVVKPFVSHFLERKEFWWTDQSFAAQ